MSRTNICKIPLPFHISATYLLIFILNCSYQFYSCIQFLVKKYEVYLPTVFARCWWQEICPIAIETESWESVTTQYIVSSSLRLLAANDPEHYPPPSTQPDYTDNSNICHVFKHYFCIICNFKIFLNNLRYTLFLEKVTKWPRCSCASKVLISYTMFT